MNLSSRFLIACAGLLTVFSLSMAKAQQPAPALPRVLIIGDSIYQAPASLIAAELKGKVEVVYPMIKTTEVVSSTSVLADLDTLLGSGKWDLIHFNCGLGDLIYRAPDMKSLRVMPIDSGGIRNTDPKRYESNLRELVKRLKATDAKLVWSSTTPIRASLSNVFELGSEIEYNAIAAKVMNENHIPINDMYSHIKSLINITKPAGHGADPFDFDKKTIHEPIIKIIQLQLNLK
ncbi:MAG: SGNH/GDSL hydrolase family protein [Verrucomicrobiota bacterium]